MKRNIAILGSTGSIGKQALEVVDAHPDFFQVEVLTANNNIDLLIDQSRKYKPNAVVVCDHSKYTQLKDALQSEPVKVYAGSESIIQLMEMESIDVVLTAMVGFSGLEPTLAAIRNKKQIALANKETLVVAGELVMAEAQKHGINIFPVDSEHSAIFQCLIGESAASVEKIILTASGGPFRGKTTEELRVVTKDQALRHPNWNMGSKITIDSATLMNKGLEMIEAKWLFGLKAEQIEVIVHPQSIIHSMVQFYDGSIKAQMGLPDMKLPIQYALGFPYRIPSVFPRFSFDKFGSLTFEKPDEQSFSCLAIAREAMAKGGNMPCVMNAANEEAVNAFLREEISFLQIPEVILDCLQKVGFIANPGFEDYLESDRETRIRMKAVLV